jgi:hypothetical protein
MVYKRERRAHVIIGNTDSRHSVRKCPEVVLEEIHSVVFEILTAIAERLPVDLPLTDGVAERPSEVSEVALVRLHGLLRALELELNLLKLLALQECGLGRVRVDALAVGFVLLARLVHIGLLGLLRLPVLLDDGLERLLVMCLSSAEGSGRCLDFGTNGLSEVEVETALLLRLRTELVEGLAEVAKGS